MLRNTLVTKRESRILEGMIGIGVLGVAVGWWIHVPHLWPGLLLTSFYFLTLALGGIVFISIQHLSNAGWGTVIRRVPEAMTAYLPFGALSLLVLFFGRHALYPWTHADWVRANPILQSKTFFLNSPFFFGRMAVMLAVWTFLGMKITRESRLQDEDGLLQHTDKGKRYAGIFLVFFAVTFSLASFDWIMSIEPEFYSTIFAFYCFSGLFLAGIAAITILVILLHRRGFLPEVNEHHLHNLGKLVFAFSTFWAYIWLCQYLLIYYTNIPEETIYYLRRASTPGWRALFFLNLFLNWVFPFVMLLPRSAKRREGWLMAACSIVLLGHWVDLYTMILPAYGGSARVGWIEIALTIGFTGVFLAVFVRSLRRAAWVPRNDPYLEESLSLHTAVSTVRADGWSKPSKQALTLSTIAFSISFAVWGLISALAPRFREMYHLTAVQTSLLIAIPVLLGSVGRIPMGILADRYGGRIVFGTLLLFCLLPALGISFSHSYRGLLVWGFLLGFAGTSFSVGVAFTSKWFEPRRQGTALGVYGVGNIGQSVAMFAAPALVVLSGSWRLPFGVFGVVAGVFGIFFIFGARNAPGAVPTKGFLDSILVLKREPLAWVLSLFYFLTFGGFVALSIYLPTLLKDLFGLTLTDAGARVAGFVVVATLMRPIGGWLADRMGGAQVLTLVLILIAVFALGLTSTNMLLFTFGALGTAALLGTGNGAVFKLVPEHFPRETGAVTGLVGAAGGLGGFFPPLVLGFIKSHTGGYTLGFILLACFSVVCLAVNYWVFIRRHEEENELAIS